MTTPIATLMRSSVPKKRVIRLYSGLSVRYQIVCRIATRNARPMVTGTKKK